MFKRHKVIERPYAIIDRGCVIDLTEAQRDRVLSLGLIKPHPDGSGFYMISSDDTWISDIENAMGDEE